MPFDHRRTVGSDRLARLPHRWSRGAARQRTLDSIHQFSTGRTFPYRETVEPEVEVRRIRIPDQVDARVLSPEQLIEALRASALGMYPAEAAIGLLIEDRRWLTDDRFLRHVDVLPATSVSDVLSAVPNWSQLAVLVAPPQPRDDATAILAIAIGLVSGQYDTGWQFPELVAELDFDDCLLVMRALLHTKVGTDEGAVQIEPFRTGG